MGLLDSAGKAMENLQRWMVQTAAGDSYEMNELSCVKLKSGAFSFGRMRKHYKQGNLCYFGALGRNLIRSAYLVHTVDETILGNIFYIIIKTMHFGILLLRFAWRETGPEGGCTLLLVELEAPSRYLSAVIRPGSSYAFEESCPPWQVQSIHHALRKLTVQGGRKRCVYHSRPSSYPVLDTPPNPPSPIRTMYSPDLAG